MSISPTGYRAVMGKDPVNEADRLEQEMPPGPGGPAVREPPGKAQLPLEATEADALEQDSPLSVNADQPGIDAERSEPVSDEDWAESVADEDWAESVADR